MSTLGLLTLMVGAFNFFYGIFTGDLFTFIVGVIGIAVVVKFEL